MVTFKQITNEINKAVSDKTLAPYLAQVDRRDGDFLTRRLLPFSSYIKSVILYQGFTHKKAFDRNTYIRKITDDLFALLPEKLASMFFSNDCDIQLKAKECADYCRRIIIDPKNETFLALHQKNSVNEILPLQNSVNGKKPLKNFVNAMSLEDRNFVYEYLFRYVTTLGLDAPEQTERIALTGCLKRMADNRWWCRKLRKLINQANESAALHLNLVSRKKQIYASNITTKNRIASLARNEQLLSSHFIINDAGQRYSLQEISNVNVSNPEVRKAELINRARGFEDMSKDYNHDGLFITITCPSKYHRAFSKSGAANPKWQGLLPNDGQRYLCGVWARIRAELQRKNISIYGFRVAEPQHDGTPHWHCLFFTKQEHIKELEKIVCFYALQEDGDEKGALENRCDFKKVDPAKNATGYIMKYIVKNIDGKGLGEDKFGNDSMQVAQRINAWASCWCIRQFQQIGGASVTVWRELRRLKKRFAPESLIEKARVAADNSDWKGYVDVMGGIETAKKQHPIKLHYDINVNEETGECSQSYYDGELVLKVKGINFDNQIIITRTERWRIERGA